MTDVKVLIVDDDDGVVFACRRMFERDGHRVVSASDGNEGLEAIRREQPDLVFMDISMPGVDGLTALERLKADGFTAPVVIITGFGTMQTAIQAVKLGAYDYLTKPLDVEQVRTIAARALETAALRSQVGNLQAQLTDDNADDLVGDHASMQEVFKTIGAVSATPNQTPVLILGESGTGKELVARAIHRSGPSPESPFIPINCTALPGELLESELFGYERGAFTGAIERRRGRFEIAGSGTIFLDEIGDMPLELQQKLLRVIQEREFARLGGNASMPVQGRFVLATHTDLEEAVGEGRFREDLYFRISVIPIRLPPLRQRKEDLPRLIDHLLNRLNRKLNRRAREVSAAALSMLSAYDYPGNVRELENILERAVILTAGDVIFPSSFPDGLRAGTPTAQQSSLPATDDWRVAREQVLQAFQEQFIRRALARSCGSVTDAARRSGLERQSFQRLMKRCNIDSRDYRDD